MPLPGLRTTNPTYRRPPAGAMGPGTTTLFRNAYLDQHREESERRSVLVHRERTFDVGVQELADELVLRVEQLLLRSRLDDLALPEHGDEVGDPARGSEVVADHQVAAAVLLVDLADQLAQKRGPHRVEARVRLVEHDDRRVEHEGPGEAGALAHAAGQFVGHLVVRLTETDLAQAAGDDLFDLVLALVRVLAQRKGDVVVDVHRPEQGPVLEEQAELLADLEQLVVGHVRDRLAGHEGIAGIRIEETDDVLDEHALARPRGAEHHRNLIIGQAEVEAVEDARATELLYEVDDLDRVLASMVALLAGVPAIWVVVGGVDARDHVVLAQPPSILGDV